jgi:hypothetical protein
MLMLAMPMTLLFGVSEMIARFVDRRRAQSSAEPDYDSLSDEETSPLGLHHDPADKRPSRLDVD